MLSGYEEDWDGSPLSQVPWVQFCSTNSKQQNQSSCWSPSQSLKGFIGGQFKIWLPFNLVILLLFFKSSTLTGVHSPYEFQPRSPTFKDLKADLPMEQDLHQHHRSCAHRHPSGGLPVWPYVSSRWNLPSHEAGGSFDLQLQQLGFDADSSCAYG